MKKSKSKSKSRGQSLVKNEKKASEQEQINCAICRFQIKNTHQMLTCSGCKKNAHFGCYDLDLKDSTETFTCDLCKVKKRKRAYCDVCDQYDEKQILKICKVLTSASSQNLFVHTQCGILSSYIDIESYSKLEFVKKKQIQKPYNASECCANESKWPGVIIQCVQCQAKGHFRCKIVQVGQNGNNYMVSKWLDKCQRYDYLLNHIIKKKSGIKPLIDPPGKLPKDGQLMICEKHSDDYPWCYCDDWKISNNNNPSKIPDYQCDECDRYIHQPCSGLPPNYPKEFKCQGCKQHDIFKKELKLHELITQISKVEKGARFDDGIIRLLNAFPFKYSGAIQKRIIQNMKQIQLYFAKRQILKLLEKQGGQKTEKKMLQILLFLVHGQKWKQHQNFEIASNLLQSGLIKKLNLIKEQEEKIRSIVTMRVKDKKKSQEHIILKDALKKFIKQWKNFQASRVSDGYSALATAIKDIQVKFLNTVQDVQEEQKKFIDLFSRQLGNQIFGLLISKNYSVQLIKVILKKLGRVKLYQLENKQIPEQEYYKLLYDKSIKVAGQQQVLWDKFILLFKNEFKDLIIMYSAVKKEQTFKKLEKRLREKVCDEKILANVENQAIINQVCAIGHDSGVLQMKNYLIEQNILKKRLLKISSQKDCHLTEKKMKFISKMQQFLIKKKKTLNKSERQSLQSFIGKVQFIWNIFRKGEALQKFNGQPRINGQIEDLQNDNRLNIIYEKFFHILDNWDERIIPIQFVINQMYSKCVVKKVKFDNKLVIEKLTIFYRTITNRISMLLNDGQKITTQLLRKLCKILTYLKINHQYPELFELLQVIKKWISIFPADQHPVNLPAFLQKSEKVSNLLKILETKIASGVDTNKVNIISEINKLCLLRQWCKITQKMSLLHKSKATINAIQLLKGFLDKCCYPQNLYSKKVNDLDIEGKGLNKQVSKFLEKPKITEHLTFHQELKFIAVKMTLEEGLSTKHILENCNLDVFVETQELQNEIKQFELLPVQLSQFAEKKNLPELVSMRRKFIDSCFRISKIEQYEKFLRKIYVLKCLNFEGPTTREQYFDLLTVGGAAGIELQKRTFDLCKMYKTIQKAEIELSNSNIKRRNFNNLIPWSELKFKEIREDLKYDQAQMSKLQRARITNNRNREEYFNLRNKKIDLEKLKDLQLELSSSLYNNKDIILEISAIRTEVILAVRRIQQVISYSSPSPQLHSPQNVFKTQRRVHENYLNYKVTHPTLQKFESDCKNYYKAEQLRFSELNPENYRIYCDACSRVSQPGCRIPQFLNSRANEYIKMHKIVMQAEQTSINMIQLLITEGLQIRRLDSPYKQRVFDMVIQLYEKLQKFTNEKRDDQEDNSQRRDYEHSYDSQQMESDQEEDENDGDFDSISSDFDDDSDDDDEDQENGNANGNVTANAKDHNQIVLDSD